MREDKNIFSDDLRHFFLKCLFQLSYERERKHLVKRQPCKRQETYTLLLKMYPATFGIPLTMHKVFGVSFVANKKQVHHNKIEFSSSQTSP